MKILESVIFGAVVPTFFTTDIDTGVSISEVSRRQAEYKQQNDAFYTLITEGTTGIFNKVIKFVGASSSPAEVVSGRKLRPETFKECTSVGNRNAETALLMHGVKLYKNLEAWLQTSDLTGFVGGLPSQPVLPTAPTAPARGKAATVCPANAFMELSTIDEMVANLNTIVIAKFDFDFWQEAVSLNAKAAAIGKLLTEKDSFFRALLKVAPNSSEQTCQTGVILTKWERSYTENEAAELQKVRDSLQEEYDRLQKQLNGMKKRVKDAVRAYNLEVEKTYQSELSKYQLEASKHRAEVDALTAQHAQAVEKVRSSAETLRQEALAELATLRVRVP